MAARGDDVDSLCGSDSLHSRGIIQSLYDLLRVPPLERERQYSAVSQLCTPILFTIKKPFS